ncbi:MAG: CYTH domain-containing protein [Candidatus Aenigmarchaeota archaeon]|nr:CYTH domain-containing protein [Candidatus Aenigmarchaeota archaeon]
MKGIEVEFRFKIEDEEKVKEFLAKLNSIKKIQQKDVYFDTKNGDLFKRGIFVRLRNDNTLDLKFNLEDKENKHEDCSEYSFTLPLSDPEKLTRVCKILDLKSPETVSLENFLEENNLKEFEIIDKIREKFSDGEFTFCLDDIKGFGKFLEIESVVSEGTDLDELKKRMIERVSIFNPKFLPTGYIELFVKEKDFNLYKQGRYLLEEDKN